MDPKSDLADELLRELCHKHGVPTQLMHRLLEIERKHQFRERRYGVYDELQRDVRSALDTDGQ